MTRARELIDALRETGTPVDAGSFSLDAEASRRKFEEFAYASRGVYLVPMVEALVALGAVAVSIDVDVGDVVVQATGARLDDPARGLTNLFSAAFEDLDDDQVFARARLAVAVDMAVGHRGIRAVAIETATDDERVVATYDDERGATVVAAELRSADPRAFVRIYVDRSHAQELRAIMGGTVPEEIGAVTRAAEHCRIPVHVGNERMDRAAKLELAETVRGAGFVGRFGFVAEAELAEGPELRLLSRGVVAARLLRPQWAAGSLGIVELDAMRRDLSQMAPQQDDRYQEAMAAFETAASAAVERLRDASAAWSSVRSSRPPGWPDERVRRVLGLPPRFESAVPARRSGRALVLFVVMGLVALGVSVAVGSNGGASPQPQVDRGAPPVIRMTIEGAAWLVQTAQPDYARLEQCFRRGGPVAASTYRVNLTWPQGSTANIQVSGERPQVADCLHIRLVPKAWVPPQPFIDRGEPPPEAVFHLTMAYR